MGLDMMIDPPSPNGLDNESAFYLPGSPNMGLTAPSEGPSESQACPRSNPPPNPPFVFPARPSSSSGLSSISRTSGRRPRSAIEPRMVAVESLDAEKEKPASRSPALPAFSFNPGASLPPSSGPPVESMFLSPPQSPSAPNSPRLAASRPAGHKHRRGGSEFVGGSIRDGEAITVMNVSPTKSDSGMASPLLQPTKPRRGHAHRRSAAISSHDLSSIISPPAPAVPAVSASGSLPIPAAVEPPAVENPPPAETEVTVPDVAPAPPVAQASDPSAPTPSLGETPKPVARNRVGFSDTLEYIPRPLSLVSTDTSSTVTARPGHSLSGSISSLLSVSNADREVAFISSSGATPMTSDSRPSTAGAVMERSQSAQEQEQAPQSPRRRGSIPLLGSLPPPAAITPATPSPTRSSKKWSFFSLDPFAAGSPTRAHPDSPRSTTSHLSIAGRNSREQDSSLPLPESAANDHAPKPPSKKRGKKKKKVKTWAGSILSRKGKHRHGKQKRRAPTPPPPRFPELRQQIENDLMEMSPEPDHPNLQSSENGDWETWTFPKSALGQDEDASYQMIDLDAALGPFNTPLPRNPEWEAAQKAGGLIKKQLHSAAGMSRFTGPGMHYYHRRAESAPELAPFEGGRFGFRRFGSSSTMADVFEEDEEDEEGESCESSTGSLTPPVDTSIIGNPDDEAPLQTLPDFSTTAALLITKGAEAKTFQPDDASKKRFESVPGVSLGSGNDAPDSVESAPSQSQDVPRLSVDDAACGSATPSSRHPFRPKDLAPVEVGPLNLPSASLGPVSPWSTTQSSAIPSPKSPVSYDAQCLSTAPSSVAEDTFQSLLMGEPGPEVRISVDDIPSLTSSNSTMTRESLFAHHPQARHPPLGDQPRPASFTSTAFGRRRSSLASLSRLINSSHGERSKLSIEVPLETEPEKKSKNSKAKRLSRMMQFWKSKEDHVV
ncbi:uncharacterized protein C8A04DRAFT_24275 [Dichotomopilus funicola]|uniref:Cell wall proline rich protein n=1 Tax=Dichotomopilus funicola TaxID=1934379 RepID=A0AAN6ZR14_9PEZI|nr:hypothetical protein C8A04DRAFT_24275 [Dichotomopilus funicola]